MEKIIRIVGGGLAGAEAAYQLARRGVRADLYEMRPHRMTEAHATGDLGELVCSNSLRSSLITAPAGVLKEEMRRLDSLVIRVAESNRVPAGSALAVDRESFARALTRAVEALPKVRIVRQEVQRNSPGPGDRSDRTAHFDGAVTASRDPAWVRASLFSRCDFAYRHRGIDWHDGSLPRFPVWERRQ